MSVSIAQIQAEKMIDYMAELQELIRSDKQQAPWINAEYKCHLLEKMKTILLLALDQAECDRQTMGKDGKR